MESVNTSTIDEAIAADTPEHAPEEPMSAPELKPACRGRRSASVTIGLALLITMAEISRLSGSMLDTAGQAWSFNELAGFGSFSSRAGWRADFNSAFEVRGIFLVVYVAADFAFILIYGILIYGSGSDTSRSSAEQQRVLLLILVVADVIEDAWRLSPSPCAGRRRHSGCSAVVLALVNAAKTLACVAVVFMVLRDLLTTRGRTVRALVAGVLPTHPPTSLHRGAASRRLRGVDCPGSGDSRSVAGYCAAVDRRTRQLHVGGWLRTPRPHSVYHHAFPGWSNADGRRRPLLERPPGVAAARGSPGALVHRPPSDLSHRSSGEGSWGSRRPREIRTGLCHTDRHRGLLQPREKNQHRARVDWREARDSAEAAHPVVCGRARLDHADSGTQLPSAS